MSNFSLKSHFFLFWLVVWPDLTLMLASFGPRALYLTRLAWVKEELNRTILNTGFSLCGSSATHFTAVQHLLRIHIRDDHPRRPPPPIKELNQSFNFYPVLQEYLDFSSMRNVYNFTTSGCSIDIHNAAIHHWGIFRTGFHWDRVLAHIT